MKSKLLIGSIIVWVVVFLAITLVPENALSFSKQATYLVFALPMTGNLALIVFLPGFAPTAGPGWPLSKKAPLFNLRHRYPLMCSGLCVRLSYHAAKR